MTPEELAKSIGVSRSVVYRHIRQLLPREQAEAGRRWNLSDEQVGVLKRQIGAGRSRPAKTTGTERDRPLKSVTAGSPILGRNPMGFTPPHVDLKPVKLPSALVNFKPVTMPSALMNFKPVTMPSALMNFKPVKLPSALMNFKPVTVPFALTEFRSLAISEVFGESRPPDSELLGTSTNLKISSEKYLERVGLRGSLESADEGQLRALFSRFMDFIPGITPSVVKGAALSTYLCITWVVLVWSSKNAPEQVAALQLVLGVGAELLIRYLNRK